MNEADSRKAFELTIQNRVDRLEERVDRGAIARNAAAMKATIEQWNKMYLALDTRMVAMENNLLSILQLVKTLEDSNTLALQKLRGTGPTSGD